MASSSSPTTAGPGSPSLLFLALGFLVVASQVAALNADEWRERSVYQIVTDRFATTNGSTPSCASWIKNYCDGSWLGIIDHLDYIQGMGFDAIWISPIAKNIDTLEPISTDQPYHGYWNTNDFALSGPAEDLLALSDALHARGMALMVDIVVNHVAWVATNDNYDFDPTIGESASGAGDGPYGSLDQKEDFHSPCVMDYNNETSVEVCWLDYPASLALVDVNTTSTRVRTLLYARIKELVSTFNIDGLRIDTARQVEGTFWEGFQTAAGVFTMGEIFDSDPYYVSGFQTYPGMDSVLNYPIWYDVVAAFTSTTGSMKDLSDMLKTVRYWFTDSRLLGSFVANHDVARPRSATTDTSLLANLFAYPFVTDGIPIFYYGDEQSGSVGPSDPENREALWTLGSSPYDTTSSTYQTVALYNAVRTAAAAYSSSFYSVQADAVQYSDSEIVITKAPLISILTNRGSAQASPASVTFLTSYTPGTVVVNTLSCNTTTVDANAKLTVSVVDGLPQMYLPLAALSSSSGFCTSLL